MHGRHIFDTRTRGDDKKERESFWLIAGIHRTEEKDDRLLEVNYRYCYGYCSIALCHTSQGTVEKVESVPPSIYNKPQKQKCERNQYLDSDSSRWGVNPIAGLVRRWKALLRLIDFLKYFFFWGGSKPPAGWFLYLGAL